MTTPNAEFESTRAAAAWSASVPVLLRRISVFAAGLLLVGLTMCAAPAQDEISIQPNGQTPENSADADAIPSPTDPLQVLSQRIVGLTTAAGEADVDDETRQRIRALLTQATADIEVANDLAKQNTALQERLKRLPQDAERLREPPPLPDTASVESRTIAELEGEEATLGISLTAAVQELAKRQQDADSTADRKRSLQETVQAAEQSLTAADEALRGLPEKLVTLLDEAVRAEAEAARFKAARFKAVAENDFARTSLAELDARLLLNLPTMHVLYQQSQISLYEARIKLLQTELESRRQEQSRSELEKAHEAEDQLATIENKEIRALGELRLHLATKNNLITQQQMPHWKQILERRELRLKELEKESNDIRERVERFGTNATLGRELLRFGSKLPSLSKIRAEIAEIDDLTAGWRLQEIEYAVTSDRIDAVAEKFADTATDAESDIFERVPDVLRQLNHSNTRCFLLLANVNGADRRTIGFIESWTEFSSEHALWLRSHEPITNEDFTAAVPAIQDNGRRLVESLNAVARGAGATLWALLIPAGLAIGILLAVQSHAKDGLMRRGEEAFHRTCMSMRPTMWALLLSVGMAAEWPMVLMLLGTMVQLDTDLMAIAFGQTLIQLGGIAMWLNFFRQVLRRGGLASHHLMWNQIVCDRLRRWLHFVFLFLAVPLFLFLLARNIPDQTDTAERILLLLLLACSTILLCRLFLSISGPFVQTLVSQSRFLHATRFGWIAVIVATPLILAICSATGFHHTALSLCDRLGWSVVAGTGVILGWSLVMRWLRMNHRAMRMALARERAQQRDQAEETTEGSLPQQTVVDESELLVFGTQARQLVRNVAILVMIGCVWGIWFDILPALRIVDRHELWSVQEQVSVSHTSETGEPTTTQRWKSRPVTIGSLLLVAFASAVTFIGVRQLPGLIGMILLRHSNLDSGVRYTITTVVRYIILIAGTTIVCHTMGLRWSQVQWLVAGLSVGLGFGLQEVFANFVSGIIILVERPIRIGDVVTIDGVSGVVSKIQIRATSITDWDRREYIVPNRDLVTGKLLNWTLSDSTNRIMIKVGIGYGCSPDQARAAMLRIAKQHPNVLEDPGPMATFENFGDSSLDLVLRAFLPDMDNRLGTITELNTQIHRSFAEEGIDIPFPQREVRML